MTYTDWDINIAGQQGQPGGPQGPPGATGLTGLIGLTGATGALGASGATGGTGPQGAVGGNFPDAPSNNYNYGRDNGGWYSGGNFANLINAPSVQILNGNAGGVAGGPLYLASSTACVVDYLLNGVRWWAAGAYNDGSWRVTDSSGGTWREMFDTGGNVSYNVNALHCYGAITAGNNITAGSSSVATPVILATGSSQPTLAMYETNNPSWGWSMWTDSGAVVRFGTGYGSGIPTGTVIYFRGSDWAMIHGYQAYKPGGGSWADSSDARIKDVLGDYQGGLKEIVGLKPVRYQFKDNDTEAGPDEGPNGEKILKLRTHASVKGRPRIGIVAQDIEKVMPECITLERGNIDGKDVDDMRIFHQDPILFALINAVKELSARIEKIEAKKK